MNSHPPASAEVLAAVAKIVTSPEGEGCPCQNMTCPYHGDCYCCVKIHRVMGLHVPDCLQPILMEKIGALAKTVEMRLEK